MLENTIARNKRRLIILKGISQDLEHSEISARALAGVLAFRASEAPQVIRSRARACQVISLKQPLNNQVLSFK